MTSLPTTTKPKLIERFAERYGVEPTQLMDTLKATAFRTEKPASNEQMMALLVVAEQYSLNPWTKELFAFPDKQSGIVPVVSVDGWSRICNEHPQFDGVEFRYSDTAEIEWIECIIYRKDREHPTVAREYLAECKRNTSPWNSHPRRMLRHKAMIQAARLAFGFAGIYDKDEAERIIEGEVVASTAPAGQDTARLNALAEPPEPKTQPPITVEEVTQMFTEAQTQDAFDEASSLIGEFKSAKDRKVLIEAAKECEARCGLGRMQK